MLEKLKNQVMLTKSFNILPKIQKISKKSKKLHEIQGFLGTPVETPLKGPMATGLAPDDVNQDSSKTTVGGQARANSDAPTKGE